MTWLLLVVLLAASAACSAFETALFSLSAQALQEFERSPDPNRRRVHQVMTHPHRALLTLLLCNSIVNIAFFTLALLVAQRVAESWPALAALFGAATPFLVIIFAEMAPKALALRASKELAPLAAACVSTLGVVLAPLHRTLGGLLINPITRLFAPSVKRDEDVSTDELRLLVEHSARDGHLNRTESDMLQAVVALADVNVRAIMTPRVDVAWVSVDADRAAALQRFRETGRRRLLVTGRNLDDVRGFLYERDLYLEPNGPVRLIQRRAHFVPEQVHLAQLLRYFRAERVQLAVVVDEHGGTVGIVASGDVLRWLVGRFPEADASRRDEMVERVDDDTYRVSGLLSARAWADRFAVDEIEPGIDTVGGLIVAKLGRSPRVGDVVRVWNLALTVESVRHHRADRVRVRRLRDPRARSDAEPQEEARR